MLKQILEITDTLEYEENGSSTITSADWNGSDLILGLRIRINGEDDRTFHIICDHPRSHRILALADATYIDLCEEHVVLWPHNQKQGRLGFNGCSSDAYSLLGALTEAHCGAVGKWFPMDRFLNLPGRPSGILRGGHGVLAEGPVSVLDAYARVLDDYKILHSITDPRDPAWWNNHQWIAEIDQLNALIIGESFVVAPSFSEMAV